MHAAVLAIACLGAPPSLAQTRHIPLAPPDTRADFTTYAMGLWPLQGHFAQFTGEITLDVAHPRSCTVTLDIDVASLQMADPARARLATGPKLLDQAAYPKLSYRGTCGATSAGLLTLHGITRPLLLTAQRSGQTVTATGSLTRQDFGVNGMPTLIGRTIKLTLAVRLPDNLAALVDP